MVTIAGNTFLTSTMRLEVKTSRPNMPRMDRVAGIHPSSAYFWLKVRTPMPQTSEIIIAAIAGHDACWGGLVPMSSIPPSLVAQKLLLMRETEDLKVACDFMGSCTPETCSLSMLRSLPNIPDLWTTSTADALVAATPPPAS